MNQTTIFVIILISTLGFIGISIFLDIRRSNQFKAIAEKIGCEFFQDGNYILQKIYDFEIFSKGHSRTVKKLLHGYKNNIEFYIFDYHYSIRRMGSGRSRSVTYSQTVLCLYDKSLDLPKFILNPENIFDKFVNLFGYQDINFDSHPRFSRQYKLLGENEGQVRRLFNQKVLDFYETKKGRWTEVRNDQLVYYQPSAKINTEEIENFLSEGLTLFELFKEY